MLASGPRSASSWRGSRARRLKVVSWIGSGFSSFSSSDFPFRARATAASARRSGSTPCSLESRCRSSLSKPCSSWVSGESTTRSARLDSSRFNRPWLMLALLGISIDAIVSPTARSRSPRNRFSLGVRKRIAAPDRPARPVRPMRCT
ncbi:MAG: hypothetical protein ACK56F_29770, partial [bacterium]